MASKIEQPELSLADIEILKERIENMYRRDQEIVASVLNTSVMETELHIRSGVMSEAFHEAAVGLRRISKQWIM